MLSLEMIEKIANLSRLELSDHEKTEFAKQLSAALDYFGQIEQIDTDGVQPLLTPTSIAAVYRSDDHTLNGNSDDMLTNAPDQLGLLFKVPPVI